MLTFLMSLALVAQSTSPPSGSDCVDYGSTPAACEALWKQEEAAEKALNATYQRLLKKLNSASKGDVFFQQAKSDLIDAQRAWVTFREKDCDARGGIDRGLQLRSDNCRFDRAKQRTEDLQKIYDELGALDEP